MDEVTQTIPMTHDDGSCIKSNDYKPKRSEYLREYSISIRFLSVGCNIEVGCKSIAFSTIGDGMEALNQYVADPYETRKLWEPIFSSEQ